MSERGEIREPWRAVLRSAGLSDARMLLTESPQRELAGRWELLSKPGLMGRQRWRWTFDREGRDEVVYVKRYTWPPLRQQWDRIFRQTASHSAAWWECRCSEMLEYAGVPAVEAIGYAECMRGPFELCSAVLLRCVPGDALDRSWEAAKRRGDSRARGASRHAITRQLARFAAKLHDAGFRHRDLYLCHVFVTTGRDLVGVRTGEPSSYSADKDASTDALELRLIDLARVFRPRRRSERWRVKDLSQLDASAQQIGASSADRLRFFRAYCVQIRDAPYPPHSEERPVRDRSFRRLAARVTAKSDRILARVARTSSA